MGLFSSKKKTRVDTAVSRVFDENQIPDTLKETVITSTMEGGTLSEYLIDSSMHGVTSRFERMFRYGKKDYHYGLPNSSLSLKASARPAVKAAIEGILGTSIDIIYSEFGPLNNIHWARQTLVDHYGYVQASNEITVLSELYETPVYLDDVVAYHAPDTVENSDPETLETWDIPGTAGYTPERPGQTGTIGQFRKQTPYVLDEANQIDGARIDYVYREGGKLKKGSITLAMYDEDTDADYFQVKYSVDVDGKTQIRYWTYREGDGTHSTLDTVYRPGFSPNGTFFPFVVFRRNKNNRTHSSVRHTREFKTTEKLLSYIGIDFAEMGQAIHDNPDIGDVEQAVMMMAVPAGSNDPLEARYLFEFFRHLFVMTPASTNADSRSSNAFSLRDADFNINLTYSGMHRRMVPGKFGKVGNCRVVRGSQLVHQWITYSWREEGAEMYETRSVPIRQHGYRYQMQVSDSTYEEYFVVNPQLRYNIYGRHGVNAKVGDEEFLIPIDRQLCNVFTSWEREKLYVRGLHFVFNSRVTQKVRWYQSGIFKAVLIVVAIVVGFYTGQWQAFAAVVATGSAVAIAMAVVKIIVTSLVIQEGFKFTVKTLGEEAAFMLAIAAVIYGGAQALRHGSIKGAPWASEALQAANGLGTAINRYYQARLAALQQEVLDFQNYQQEMYAELEEVNNLLNAPSLVNPMLFVAGETPDNFYQRTVHSGNIGAELIDTIHHFTDMALTLPRTHDTLPYFKELDYDRI